MKASLQEKVVGEAFIPFYQKAGRALGQVDKNSVRQTIISEIQKLIKKNGCVEIYIDLPFLADKLNLSMSKLRRHAYEVMSYLKMYPVVRGVWWPEHI